MYETNDLVILKIRYSAIIKVQNGLIDLIMSFLPNKIKQIMFNKVKLIFHSLDFRLTYDYHSYGIENKNDQGAKDHCYHSN
ncbi:hypothetical protein BpHYR1_026873 [Brachionus plicatilis]|uniref:Uncharacterized protein n=1 Tax=Brachionus plicatilis TaxID=10195 RepID=A0A3M7RD85_BRAPC|nr:hypothetical protein BpHYR1_026873 [Brachionus plicatilis]